MKHTSHIYSCFLLFIGIFTSSISLAETQKDKPNFVLIFVDDLGYGDLGCYGSKTIKTPNIDRMAKEGTRFTDFYAQTVCGPSRSALMTGCYPRRTAKVLKNGKKSDHPPMSLNEITVAEVLKEQDYKTLALGKWDLAGHSHKNYIPELLPLHQGFDAYFGTPSSNDAPPPIIENNTVIEEKTDMSQLTRRYTDKAIDFMKKNKDAPFFVYLAHNMPHVQLAASEQFKGSCKAGIYGDVVQELDWNVGRILDFLKEEKLDDNTYIIFTSDNGPWFFTRSKGHQKRFGENWMEHSGSALPLRGGKTTAWEGGLRVPFIVRAPNRVPKGKVNKEIASTLDILPTFAHLAGGKVPNDRIIDGHDITPLIHGEKKAKSPTDTYYYYVRGRLCALRTGKWKLHLERPEDGWGQFSTPEDAAAITTPQLYNLEKDIAESKDVADKYPEVVKQLLATAQKAREDLGDYGLEGKGCRK